MAPLFTDDPQKSKRHLIHVLSLYINCVDRVIMFSLSILNFSLPNLHPNAPTDQRTRDYSFRVLLYHYWFTPN